MCDGEWKLPPRSLSARSLQPALPQVNPQVNPVHVSFTTDLAPRMFHHQQEPHEPNPDIAGIRQLPHEVVQQRAPLLLTPPPQRLPTLLGPAPDVMPTPVTSSPFGYYADAQNVFMLKFETANMDLSVVIALLHISGPELKNQGFHVLRVEPEEEEAKAESIYASHVVTTEFAKKWEISRKIMGLSADVTLLIIPAFLSDESADSGADSKFRVGVFSTVAPGEMTLSPLKGPLVILPKKQAEEAHSSSEETEEEEEEEEAHHLVDEVIPQQSTWAKLALWAGVTSGVGLVSYSLWRLWKFKQRRGR